MRIGYFVTKFPDRDMKSDVYGGAERSAYNMVKNLCKKKIDLIVFSTSFSSESYIETFDHFMVYRYGTNIKLLSTNISFGMFWKTLKHDIDIANVNFDIPPGPFAGLLYAKMKKVPLVINYRGDWVDDYGSFFRKTCISFFNRYLVDRLLLQADVIISPTERYIMESKFLGKYRDKIVVIPNGINLEDFDIDIPKYECRNILNLQLNEYILLFVGTLGPHKGPDILLKSFSLLAATFSNISLVFVGDGVMKDDLKKLARNLNIESKVKFVGYQSDIHKKIMYYKSSDIFILPTVGEHEVFGNVNLEAMACGIPIVASSIGGIPDLVENGVNGLLVPPRNVDELSKAILYLLKNEDIRIKMGKNGKEKAKFYSWELIAEKTKKVYEQLC